MYKENYKKRFIKLLVDMYEIGSNYKNKIEEWNELSIEELVQLTELSVISYNQVADQKEERDAELDSKVKACSMLIDEYRCDENGKCKWILFSLNNFIYDKESGDMFVENIEEDEPKGGISHRNLHFKNVCFDTKRDAIKRELDDKFVKVKEALESAKTDFKKYEKELKEFQDEYGEVANEKGGKHDN